MIVLVDWLWQGLAMAAAAGAFLACARRLDAASRHAVWSSTAAAIVVLPLATLASGMWTSDFTAVPRVSADAAFVLSAPPDWMVDAVVVVWATFVVWRLIRIAVGLRAVLLLKRAARPLDPAMLARLPQWRAVRETGSRADVLVCDAPIGACATGFGSPAILVSRALVERLSASELDAVVMHEHAHLERRDDWLGLLHATAGAFVGWHPALWYVGRGIELEREAACDDRVIARTNAPRAYASALVRAAEIRGRRPAGWLAAPAAIDTASMLRLRVARLLDPSTRRAERPLLGTSGLLALALALASVVAVRAPAVFAFVEDELALPRIAAIARGAAAPAVRPVTTVPPFAPGERTGAARVDSSLGPAEARGDLMPFPAEPQPPATAPAVLPDPADAGPVPPLASSRLVLSEPVRVVGTSAPPDQPPAGWNAVARAAAAAGSRTGAAGAATGIGAREAGLSIGRFFTRAAKTVAGR